MITRATATRFDREGEAGRNRPPRVTVETPDGEEHEVVLKVSGMPQLSVARLAAEGLAACIAGKVGLPVCRPLLVEMSPRWISTLPASSSLRAQMAHSNPVAFGSTHAGPKWQLWNTHDTIRARQRAVAAAILAFDAFIENPDRRPSNPNLLVNDDEFRLIDHELSLNVSSILPQPAPWRVGGLSWLQGDDRHVFARRLRPVDVDFDAIRAAWSGLSDDCLSDYEASLPMEWNAASAMIAAALAHVRAVRDNIDACLTEIGRILG